ncbi:MAG: phosphotransferase [Patescibacteria group bacterium]
MLKGKLIGFGTRSEVFEWGEDDALKLSREETYPLKQEFSNTEAAYRAGLPVPEPKELLRIEGRDAIVFERIHHKTTLWAQLTDEVPWMFIERARAFAELHVRIHNSRMDGLPRQREFLGEHIQRALISPSQKETILRVLNKLPEGMSPCHFDFHPDNILVCPDDYIIVDWPLANCGNPLADVARTIVLIQQGSLSAYNSRPWIADQEFRAWFLHFYLTRYLELRPGSQTELKWWEGIIAAARLAENIRHEQSLLLQRVEATVARTDT